MLSNSSAECDERMMVLSITPARLTPYGAESVTISQATEAGSVKRQARLQCAARRPVFNRTQPSSPAQHAEFQVVPEIEQADVSKS
jgi:hypothetical protein